MVQKREYKPTSYDTATNDCAKSQERIGKRMLEKEMVKAKQNRVFIMKRNLKEYTLAFSTIFYKVISNLLQKIKFLT